MSIKSSLNIIKHYGPIPIVTKLFGGLVIQVNKQTLELLNEEEQLEGVAMKGAPIMYAHQGTTSPGPSTDEHT